jgi:hypothetical protein
MLVGNSYAINNKEIIYIVSADNNYHPNTSIKDIYYNTSRRVGYSKVVHLLKLEDGNWYRRYSYNRLDRLSASREFDLSEFMVLLRSSKGYIEPFIANQFEADTYEQSRKKMSKGVSICKIDKRLVDILNLGRYEGFLLNGKSGFPEELEFLLKRKDSLTQLLKEVKSKISSLQSQKSLID